MGVAATLPELSEWTLMSFRFWKMGILKFSCKSFKTTGPLGRIAHLLTLVELCDANSFQIDSPIIMLLVPSNFQNSLNNISTIKGQTDIHKKTVQVY